jgi:hypothetical protein
MSPKVKSKHKSGYNHRLSSSKKKSGGWFWKLLMVAVLAAAVYACFKVPIAGKTVYGHVASVVRSEVTRTGASLKGLTELQEQPVKGDKLTGKDRKELQDLIEGKVKDKK